MRRLWKGLPAQTDNQLCRGAIKAVGRVDEDERGNPPDLLCAPGHSLRFRETCKMMPAEHSSHSNRDGELAIQLEN